MQCIHYINDVHDDIYEDVKNIHDYVHNANDDVNYDDVNVSIMMFSRIISMILMHSWILSIISMKMIILMSMTTMVYIINNVQDCIDDDVKNAHDILDINDDTMLKLSKMSMRTPMRIIFIIPTIIIRSS